MHAKGSGAYGTFTVTHHHALHPGLIFSRIGKQTMFRPFFDRRGGTRCRRCRTRHTRLRDEIYTDAGNWDLVGNNTPVFSARSGAVSI